MAEGVQAMQRDAEPAWQQESHSSVSVLQLEHRRTTQRCKYPLEVRAGAARYIC